jgi:hypothetical protein
MYWRKEMIDANGTLFQVSRRFKIEDFQKVIDTFTAEQVCKAYFCDKVLRGNDGFFYLVNEVKEIQWEVI